MKRIFSLLICALFALAACACGENVNMGTLTEYQSGGFFAELKISTVGRVYRAELEKSGERLFLSVKEPQALEDFTFVLDGEGCAVLADGAQIPFGAGELFPLGEVYGLFFVSVAGTWKIERSSPGGVSLYVCHGDGVTLYIDASSHLPLRITSADMEVDLLSFTVAR